jgi:hypothetical protein
MSKVTFEQIQTAVVNEIVLVTNAYALLTDFAFPIARQGLLRDHYPFFVDNLNDALRGQVLIGICRLFDPSQRRRDFASLTNFLQRVAGHHASDPHVDLQGLERRKEYARRIPEHLADIRERWKPLVIHRNAYLAHLDLTKTPPEMTYRFLRECFEQAQAVVAAYSAAYQDTTRLFDIPGVKRDAARLLEWCRFDDYERQFREDMEKRKLRAEERP